MEEKEFVQLLEKVTNGTASDKELALYLMWCKSFETDRESGEIKFDTTSFKAELFESIQSKIRPQVKFHGLNKIWFQISAAAILLATVSIGIFFYTNSKSKNQPLTYHSKTLKNDIAPGGNKAFLTLANGRRINLNEAANGRLAEQEGIEITKTASGQLVYTISSAAVGSSNVNKSMPGTFNIIETPRGGQYQINLPDGTKVWLNANSSLRYPTRFTGNERNVNLNGEAYFEVAKNASKPFKVQGKNQVIEVIGTHFNINSYNDEPLVRTTLLEGAVKVTSKKSGKSKLLKPNEQSIFNANNDEITIENVNTEEAVAWKNGLFIFVDEDLKSVIRKVARWYDVDVEYRGKIDDSTFSGIVSRSQSISQVIEIIEKTSNYKIKIEERRLIIMP